MPSAGFEPTFPASEQQQTHTFGGKTIGIGLVG